MQACYLADLGGAVLGAAPQVDCRRVYEGNTSLRVRTRQVLAFRPLFSIVLPIFGARPKGEKQWNIRKEKREWRARQSLRGSENTRKENGISERRMEVRGARQSQCHTARERKEEKGNSHRDA